MHEARWAEAPPEGLPAIEAGERLAPTRASAWPQNFSTVVRRFRKLSSVMAEVSRRSLIIPEWLSTSFSRRLIRLPKLDSTARTNPAHLAWSLAAGMPRS